MGGKNHFFQKRGHDRVQQLSAFCRPAIGKRGSTQEFLEQAREVVRIFIAEASGDFLDAHRRGIEVMTGSLHAEADMEVDGGGSGLFAEQRGVACGRESEIGRAHV